PHDRCAHAGHLGKTGLWSRSRGWRSGEGGQRAFTKFMGVRTVDGAGRWAHEEQPEIASRLLTSFL
ncbi:MAG TPA: hypothetical protein VFO87_09820, partial [Nitrospira sp.]|nr:hypothetical protein [Nitrospira sp.]